MIDRKDKFDGHPDHAHSLKEMIGMRVCDKDGQEAGTLTDIIVDMNNGMVAYLELTVDGRRFAVPFGSVELDDRRHALVLKMHRSTFQRSPGREQ
ncbi:MAG: hypothetical protein GC162_04285 [Planctomycetes bacterium]|nr:hypothetical protein [Planctomycetota bacterium]